MAQSDAHRKQRGLKWFIRLMLPVVTLAGFGGLASLSLIGYSEASLIRSEWSPSGSYRASIFASDACGEGTNHLLVVERRWGWIKTGQVEPFCFKGIDEQLTVKWVGPAELAITCHDCDPEHVFFDSANWGRLHYRYDLER